MHDPWRLPLRLQPVPVPRVWGGERILREIHRGLAATPPIGETWEVSDVGDDPAIHSVIVEGPARGRTLRQLIESDPRPLLGEGVLASSGSQPRLPLLFKYIDARETLSVQVHPSDRTLRELGLPGRGKSEAWLILDADAGATVIYGFEPGWDLKRSITRARLGEGGEGLRRVPVHRGDAISLPAGVVHAIGKGILLAEIQQSSDITYRIHDWDRLGLDGRPRALHLEEAARVTPPQLLPPCPLPAPKASPGREWIPRIEEPHFSVRELRAAAAGLPFPHSGDRFAIFALLAGEASIEAEGGERIHAARGDTLLFPAAAGPCRLAAGDDAWALWMEPGIPRSAAD
ncbi:MAG: type I phosphomannose isomerase catalytic subunit [Planctomycetota bacterium]